MPCASRSFGSHCRQAARFFLRLALDFALSSEIYDVVGILTPSLGACVLCGDLAVEMSSQGLCFESTVWVMDVVQEHAKVIIH